MSIQYQPQSSWGSYPGKYDRMRKEEMKDEMKMAIWK